MFHVKHVIVSRDIERTIMPIVVNPGSTVTLYEQIPFPADQTSTLWFDVPILANQRSFFANWPKKRTYENLTYIRQTGLCRLDMHPGDGFMYNYMSFTNPDSGLVFYAFIVGVEYINNNTVQFQFGIDYLQTYMAFLTFRPCYVDREHVASDKKGQHTEKEPFNGVGQYVFECMMTPYVGDPNLPEYPQAISSFNSANYRICMFLSFNPSEIGLTGVSLPGLYNNLYCGLYLKTFLVSEEGIAELKIWIDTITEENKVDGIKQLFMAPLGAIINQYVNENRGMDFHLQFPMEKLGLYTPKNNKMYTYPYCFCYATNNEGSGANYKFEYFDEYEQKYGNVFFNFTSQFTGNPVIGLVPRNYLGSLYNYNEMLTTSSFPLCAWTSDTYQAYLAQNSGKLSTMRENLRIDYHQNQIQNTIGLLEGAYNTTVGAGVAIASGGAAGLPQTAQGITQLLGGGFNMLNTGIDYHQAVATLDAQLYDISTLPPQAHSIDTSTMTLAAGIKGFELYYCYVNSESARIIDNYFTMYGYHVARIKVPEFHSRKTWNYIRTVDCSVTGQASADVLTLIQHIFDRGVTLWHVKDNIDAYGDYTQDNSIVG